LQQAATDAIMSRRWWTLAVSSPTSIPLGKPLAGHHLLAAALALLSFAPDCWASCLSCSPERWCLGGSGSSPAQSSGRGWGMRLPTWRWPWWWPHVRER